MKLYMWIKGNLHCHTTCSDGDSDPSEVCRFYAEHGYHFLSITDHGKLVPPGDVDAHGLLLIPGEELHASPIDAPGVPIHVNGFAISETVDCQPGPHRAGTIQNCVDAVVAAGGVAQINHPNWHYAFNHDDIGGVSGCRLIEVYNGHPDVRNDGDAEHISVEQMWDHLLSRGRLYYATAVDDAHRFLEFAPHRANPLRGWVWTHVNELTVEAVLGALSAGDFYASTGVELDDVTRDGRVLRVRIRPEPAKDYTIRFIGRCGRVVHECDSTEAELALDSEEDNAYLRAKIIASDGTCAWTQPVFAARLAEEP